MKNESLIQFHLSRRRRWTRASLAAGLGLAFVAAQVPAPLSERERSPIIVVPGERVTAEAAREKAARFVRSTGVAAGTIPAARWVDPICPEVQGLEEIGKRAAEIKIRSVAASAGVDVASERCRANIIINFTPEPAGLVRAIERVGTSRLGQLTPSAREAMRTGSAPIRWMYSTEVRSRHGTMTNAEGGAGQSTAATHVGSGAGGSLGGDITMVHYENSLVSTLTNRVLTSAIVIIDTDAAMGRRLDALAAYAALVALAEIRNAGATPEGSILSMFASSAPPRDLTAQDLAFLRALYRMPLDRKAIQHRGQLMQGITQTLAARQ